MKNLKVLMYSGIVIPMTDLLYDKAPDRIYSQVWSSMASGLAIHMRDRVAYPTANSIHDQHFIIFKRAITDWDYRGE